MMQLPAAAAETPRASKRPRNLDSVVDRFRLHFAQVEAPETLPVFLRTGKPRRDPKPKAGAGSGTGRAGGSGSTGVGREFSKPAS